MAQPDRTASKDMVPQPVHLLISSRATARSAALENTHRFQWGESDLFADAPNSATMGSFPRST